MSSESKQKRYGLPQFVALLLLAIFVAQAAYLAQMPLTGVELHFRNPGQMMNDFASPARISPLTARMAGLSSFLQGHDWTARLPFLLIGVLLGASLWYVARRLFGNAGGYIALTLYCFSPSMITYAARVQPEIAAAWGMFGCIFTGIAVAHTLYAPREVVLWNWKRIVLLAVSIGVGVTAQFAVLIAVPIALGLMFYLVPERRRAALAILGAAAVLGGLLVAFIYGLDFAGLAMAARPLGGLTARMLASVSTWRMIGVFLVNNGSGLVLLLIGSLITYAAWRRTRFFGNTAPVLVALLLILVGLALPHAAGFGFLVVALPFLFVFVAGVAADLLQTRYAPLVSGIILAALVAQAYFSLAGLWRLHQS